MRKSYITDFEDVYLRQDCMKRTSELNTDYLVEFRKIIDVTAALMYRKYERYFSLMGFNLDDAISISNLYAMYYMDLYSIRNVDKERIKFTEDFVRRKGFKPTDEDFYKAEKSHLINFLRQKLRYCHQIFIRKSKLNGYYHKTIKLAHTENSVEADDLLLLEDYAKYGYRKVTNEEYKEAKKRAKEYGHEMLSDTDGFEIFTVHAEYDKVYTMDNDSLMDKLDKSYTPSIEDKVIEIEEDSEATEMRNLYNFLDEWQQKEILEDFVAKHKGRVGFKTQVALARKKLRDKNFVL